MEKVRIQFSQAELKTIKYHLLMEMDSMREVLLDLYNSENPAEEDNIYALTNQLDSAKRVLDKVERHIKIHTL